MGHPLLSPEAINSLGLSLDILGVGLLFFFGIPSEAGLDGVLTWTRGSSRDYRRARVFSRLGLALLVAGFGLQIASDHLGNRVPAAHPAVPCAEIEN